MRLFIIIICGIFLLAIPIIPLMAVTIEDPLGGKEAKTIISTITNALSTLAIVVGAIMIIVSGFMYMTSGGNQERIEKAKKTLLYTVIGVAIVIAADFIIDLVQELLGKK